MRASFPPNGVFPYCMDKHVYANASDARTGRLYPPCNIIVMRNFTLMRYCECPEGMGLCSRVHGAFRATCARSCRGRGGVPGRHLVGIESVEKIVPQPIGAVLRNKVSCQTPPTPHYKTGHTCLLGIVYPATQPHALRASSPPNPAPPRHD